MKETASAATRGGQWCCVGDGGTHRGHLSPNWEEDVAAIIESYHGAASAEIRLRSTETRPLDTISTCPAHPLCLPTDSAAALQLWCLWVLRYWPRFIIARNAAPRDNLKWPD